MQGILRRAKQVKVPTNKLGGAAHAIQAPTVFDWSPQVCVVSDLRDWTPFLYDWLALDVFELFQANRKRKWVAVSWTHMTDLLACRSMRTYILSLDLSKNRSTRDLRQLMEQVWCYALSDYFGSYCRKMVIVRRCNSDATCSRTSIDIFIFLNSFPKHRNDTLGVLRFLGYFYTSTPTYHAADKSTT